MNLFKPSLKLMFEADEDAESSISSKPTEDASVDRQILRHIMDAERTAVKVGKGQQSMTATESIRRTSLAFLFEAEGETEGEEKTGMPPIDLGIFATEVMRIVKNYDTLLDIPSVIVNRTEDYLQTKYDDDTAQKFMEILKTEFDYEPSPEGGPTTSDDDKSVGRHFAVGAMPGGGGAV